MAIADDCGRALLSKIVLDAELFDALCDDATQVANVPRVLPREVYFIWPARNKPWRRGTGYPALGGVARDEATETSLTIEKLLQEKTITTKRKFLVATPE